VSEQDVELVRTVFDAINRRDVQAVLDAYHPDADMSTLTSELVQGKSYRGHTGIREYFSSFADVWEELRLEPEEIHDLGDDRILVVGRWSSRGKESGADVESPAAWLFGIRDGQIVFSRAYRDAEEALSDAPEPRDAGGAFSDSPEQRTS
jgi:ketosteroid isomerase-like protein